MRVRYLNLENWKQVRKDKNTEQYWINNPTENSFEEYQKKWNFREVDYNHEPSNNGLDVGNPAFAFDKKLVKYTRLKSCVIVDGMCTDIKYED